MVKGTEDDDFERLKELGFKFDDENIDDEINEYSTQPDSGGVIGGSRGRQEYGLTDEESIGSPDEDDGRDDPDALSGVDLDPDPVPYGDDAPPGMSNWSSAHALRENELLEEYEGQVTENAIREAAPAVFRRPRARKPVEAKPPARERQESGPDVSASGRGYLVSPVTGAALFACALGFLAYFVWTASARAE